MNLIFACFFRERSGFRFQNWDTNPPTAILTGALIGEKPSAAARTMLASHPMNPRAHSSNLRSLMLGGHLFRIPTPPRYFLQRGPGLLIIHPGHRSITHSLLVASALGALLLGKGFNRWFRKKGRRQLGARTILCADPQRVLGLGILKVGV